MATSEFRRVRERQVTETLGALVDHHLPPSVVSASARAKALAAAREATLGPQAPTTSLPDARRLRRHYAGLALKLRVHARTAAAAKLEEHVAAAAGGGAAGPEAGADSPVWPALALLAALADRPTAIDYAPPPPLES